MSLETAALDHACNVVRRQFEGELDNFTLFFIIHEPGQRQQALESKHRTLQILFGNPDLYTALSKDIETNAQDDCSKFAALGLKKEKTLFGLKTRETLIACFFVNADEFKTETAIQQGIYHLCWHALNLLEQRKIMRPSQRFAEGNIALLHQDKERQAQDNMLADAFSAIMMERHDHKRFIHHLAQQRCNEALTATPNHKPEDYPYPIAAEATQIVYKELSEIHEDKGGKGKTITKALQMTKEIGVTYDEHAIRQWTAFSTAAQRMAWLDHDRHKILSTAIYSSEDPYVRSTAYIVSETLNIEPAIITNMGFYNPFTDQEVNERLHKKHCIETLEILLSKYKKKRDANIFIQKAIAQNTRLIRGRFTGWCAHALLEIYDALQKPGAHSDPDFKYLHQLFEKTTGAMPWSRLFELSDAITKKKQDGTEITNDIILTICEQNEQFNLIPDTFYRAAPEEHIEQDKKGVSFAKPTKPAPANLGIALPEDTGLTLEDDNKAP